MKTIVSSIILLAIFTCESISLDTTSVKYFPLKVGNRWTWHKFSYPYPPPGYESLKILSTIIINNHIYYYSRYDVYWDNGILYNTVYPYYRIDSSSGNLYSYDNQSQTECLLDSLNSNKNDSARCCDAKWYKCVDTGYFSIFNSSYKSKLFGWTNYFEGADDHTLALNIGSVQAHQYGATYQTTWSLRGCLINGVLYGDTTIVGINKISSEIPNKFSLSQNYPNPFNPITKIKFDIPPSKGAGGMIQLIIYDVLGREVATLVNEQLKPGTYEVEWDGTNYPSGVYFYKLITADYAETRKMVLVK